MAKKEDSKGCNCENCQCGLTITNGFKLGFGFFLANLLGVVIIGVIAWAILLLASSNGIIF